MNSRTPSIFAALLALSLGSSCVDFKRGEYWEDPDELPGGEDESGGGSLSYAFDVHDVLVSGCARCHAPAGSASSTDFILSDDIDASYESTLRFVNTESPSSSSLLSKGAGRGHGGGAVYEDDSAEYALILSWIEGGAQP